MPPCHAATDISPPADIFRFQLSMMITPMPPPRHFTLSRHASFHCAAISLRRRFSAPPILFSFLDARFDYFAIAAFRRC
jgi:hypothetical protein